MTDERRRSKSGGEDPVASALRAAGPRPDPPVDAEARIREQVERTWNDYSRARRQRRRRARVAGLGVAASVLVGVALAGWAWWNSGEQSDAALVATITRARGLVSVGRGAEETPARRGQSVGEGAVLKTAMGSGLALALPQDAFARVDEGTTLRIESESRLYLEKGRVYVDTGETGRSVEVGSAFGTVRDIGTQYEVTCTDEALRVRVRDGLVEVETLDDRATLRRGEAAESKAGGTITRSPIAPHDVSWRWLRRDAALPLERPLTVAALVRWFAREEGYRVEYTSARAEERAAEATLEGDLSALPRDELLELALSATSFTAARQRDRIVISLPDS